MFFFFFKKNFIIDTKLVPDDDPENAKHEFAFDNLAFKGKYKNASFFKVCAKETREKISMSV